MCFHYLLLDLWHIFLHERIESESAVPTGRYPRLPSCFVQTVQTGSQLWRVRITGNPNNYKCPYIFTRVGPVQGIQFRFSQVRPRRHIYAAYQSQFLSSISSQLKRTKQDRIPTRRQCTFRLYFSNISHTERYATNQAED